MHCTISIQPWNFQISVKIKYLYLLHRFLTHDFISSSLHDMGKIPKVNANFALL